ncbi:6-carboxytetrahydropterin synthase QueD [Desulfatibacillum aliphaticivorans]|uniref:6-carboxy-5,6,7,8-tetrahydropterin synthase n=1 Tax=Desulfatibacillum aliphaticivorans TaxID=218208 RepID=B8FGI6_DESAL|nr:6-carboxytetrahydropterin synthase QueD [Desulfatibacillum aliphaticivorans]ACL04895.1 queuosine biosynthesis protein QueD [Desulfatibacillum aliphaticivorans]
MYELKVKTDFAAAHRLTLVGHKCENLHGHNWKVEVCIKGDGLDEGGVLMDFGVIKKSLRGIMEELDHKFLNELEMFSECPPSSENIARIIADKLGAAVNSDKARVYSVTAWESDNASATYIV